MKRILSLILMFGLIMTFSACQRSGEDAAGTIAVAETIAATENEEVTSGTEAEVESTSAKTNDNKEIEVEAHIDKDETTKVPITTTVPVTDYIKIEDNKVEAPAYELEIPDDFEVKSDDEGLLLENKKGTIQFNIMDKTDVVTDFEAYVLKTHSTMVAAGATSDEIQDVVINGFNMKRFSMTITQEEDVLDSYCYLAQINGRTLVITLTSKDGGLKNVAAADAFVTEIEF